MSYEARILADSISPDDIRLLTILATYPRFIHSEVMTHRAFSRNAASSRAIPTEKNIERVLNDPFIPETFNKRVKGMGVGEEIVGDELDLCRMNWLFARDEACRYAKRLNNLGIDKSRANRLLEPFVWMTTIISATEWDNFFGLRDHPAAQPEFQIIARMMREAIGGSDPFPMGYGEWHLPLVTLNEVYGPERGEQEPDWDRWKKVSAGRCARVSFDTHENYETPEASIERAERLMGNGHFSPFEHVARPMQDNERGSVGERNGHFMGNFRGWVQFRKEVPYEDRFDLAIATQGEQG